MAPLAANFVGVRSIKMKVLSVLLCMVMGFAPCVSAQNSDAEAADVSIDLNSSENIHQNAVPSALSFARIRRELVATSRARARPLSDRLILSRFVLAHESPSLQVQQRSHSGRAGRVLLGSALVAAGVGLLIVAQNISDKDLVEGESHIAGIAVAAGGGLSLLSLGLVLVFRK
jgi:hypothetical protein